MTRKLTENLTDTPTSTLKENLIGKFTGKVAENLTKILIAKLTGSYEFEHENNN